MFPPTVWRLHGGMNTNRESFNGLRSAHCVLLLGDPDELARKIAAHSEALGEISRITFQMGIAGPPHEKHLRAFELLRRSAPQEKHTVARDATRDSNHP